MGRWIVIGAVVLIGLGAIVAPASGPAEGRYASDGSQARLAPAAETSSSSGRGAEPTPWGAFVATMYGRDEASDE